jgi:hypothetical protein
MAGESGVLGEGKSEIKHDRKYTKYLKKISSLSILKAWLLCLLAKPYIYIYIYDII